MTEAHFLSGAFLFYLGSLIPHAFVFFKKSTPRLERLARFLVVTGFLAQTVALVIRWKVTGHAPCTNMYESLVFFSWAFVASYLLADVFLKISRLGFFILVCNLALLMYAFSHDAAVKPLMPALQSNWLLLHVATCFFSYGAFAVSFIASIAYLLPFPKKHFSHEQLDQVIYKSILFGFPLLTLGVASGAVWANEAWGQYWSWDPKETWALVTWMIYALYLHLRLMKGWSEKKLAWVALVGFSFVIFTYVGVNYLLSGLHSYAK
jgi:ABC-type transport system involved in cytochrome c biogenesis permease subunit